VSGKGLPRLAFDASVSNITVIAVHSVISVKRIERFSWTKAMRKLFVIRALIAIFCVNIFTLTFVVMDALGKNYRSPEQVGVASSRGQTDRGRVAKNGVTFDSADYSAAHPSLPKGSLVEVWRPEDGRTVVVRIDASGPGDGRVMALSDAAARRLGMVGDGTAVIALRVVEFGRRQ
jgi:rare lipoprotein A